MRRTLAATLLLGVSALTACAVDGVVTSGVQSNAKPAGSAVRIELTNGLGSGVYIGNGIIITAAHVVDSAIRPVAARDGNGNAVAYGPPTVKLVSDLGDVQEGEVLWINKDYDIAAVRPKNERRFTAASLACREPDVDEPIVAEGNPVGMEFLRFKGMVSGKAREYLPNWKSAYVIDVTISSGMSGGASYDASGDVIGINVGVADVHGEQGKAASGGMGFTVPSSVVCGLLGRV
ncbi:serine protease [Mesorhizobium sp.]|uniref:S1 family peptidase n=1 Tax=Mesorhizobium sp. TaxID=1871066 RepID=UPI0011FE0615|nr:serine protease [Mesorhizobium sp.]TIN83086.1 MAG: trypsin-like peptidase domain-containing protein [Mesorhizobium sp.]